MLSSSMQLSRLLQYSSRSTSSMLHVWCLVDSGGMSVMQTSSISLCCDSNSNHRSCSGADTASSSSSRHMFMSIKAPLLIPSTKMRNPDQDPGSSHQTPMQPRHTAASMQPACSPHAWPIHATASMQTPCDLPQVYKQLAVRLYSSSQRSGSLGHMTAHRQGHDPGHHKPPASTPLHVTLPPKPSLDPATFPVNSEIKAESLVVLQRGHGPQELTLAEALTTAQKAATDLVQLPCSTEPPVALLVSHAKLKENPAYALERLKLKPRQEKVKELRFSCRTAINDLDVKLQSLRRMLEAGDRVQLVLEFKAGKEDEAAAARMDNVLQKLQEGAVGLPSKVSTPSKGVLSVTLTPREGKGGPLWGYVEAAEGLLRGLGGHGVGSPGR